MWTAIMAGLAMVTCGCASRRPDYSLVPGGVPPEAKPVWVMLAAAQADDTARLMSVCTPDKRKDIAACSPPQLDRMFQGVRELVPEGGIGELKLTVCRDSLTLIRLGGRTESEGCGDFVTRDGLAFVLVGDKTAVPVTRCRGVWLIEGNRVNQSGTWISAKPR